MQPDIATLLSEKKVVGEVEAAFYIGAGKPPELHVILKRLRQGVKVLRIEGCRLYLIDSKAFEEDVINSVYAETLAHKLLMPFQPIRGEHFLRRLEKTYKKEIIIQLLKDLVSEHKLAAANLMIDKRYFLYEKIRRLSEVFPMIRNMLVESYGNVDIVKGFEIAADELVKENLLSKNDGYYVPSMETVKNFLKIPVLSGLEQLRKINILKVSKVFPILIFDVASGLVSSTTQSPDPDQYIYLKTARGLQPLSRQLDIVDFVRELYGKTEARIKRVGGIFNSTYVIEVDTVKLFAKRYLSWTDVKWVVARIWTAWVKDFSINPSTRMAKEIYFLDQLRNHGFNTPEIIYVNWNDKILYTSYIEGVNPLTAWLNKASDRGDFAKQVGATLAQIHEKGVRLGDCKPESFIRSWENKIYVTDVEQASTDGDPSWDLMELIFYPGHYLNAEEAALFAAGVVEGYVSVGNMDIVSKSIKPSYVRTMALWTPPWVQKEIVDRVKQFLKT